MFNFVRTRHKYKDDMKKLLLVIGISFMTVCGILAQIDITSESALTYNEWHKVDTKDEFGDISGSYDVFIELADCTDVNEKDIKIVARLSRTEDNDHMLTFWSDFKKNKPFDFPYALFPTIKVKRADGNIETYEVPMMSEGKIVIFHHNPLGQLLNNGTGEQIKILINFSDKKSTLKKCLAPIFTH